MNLETLTMARFTFATKSEHAGRTRLVVVGHITHYVDYVPYGEPADITYQKYTKDYSARNSRPFVTKRAGYASLEAAVKALLNA